MAHSAMVIISINHPLAFNQGEREFGGNKTKKAKKNLVFLCSSYELIRG
jgi:hypothetical protein